MAVSKTVVRDAEGVVIATWTDTAGGGTGTGIYMGNTPIKSVQRTSGTGTYTVTGSNDGVTYGALNTAISAIATSNVIPIPENPLYLKVDVAAAAAVVVITGK
jgi:hypothetical protein